MHCYICDADSDTIQFEHGEFGPCSDCQSAIHECLIGYPDIPNPEDEELVDEGFDEVPVEYYGSRYADCSI